jgi:hypothetical protein
MLRFYDELESFLATNPERFALNTPALALPQMKKYPLNTRWHPGRIKYSAHQYEITGGNKIWGETHDPQIFNLREIH